MKKITIIDYGCGNILNLVRAIKFLGYEAETTHDKKKILNSSHLILPGVGAFGNAMEQLKKYNLHNTILEYVNLNKPLFGICLGMQILLTLSHEFGIHKGLGLIEGEVIKISNEKKQRNKNSFIWDGMKYIQIMIKRNGKTKFLKNSLIGKSFYFVHSFICLTKNSNSVIAVCKYSDISIPAVISMGNIFGCQFHPEKSADNGLAVLKNFCEI